MRCKICDKDARGGVLNGYLCNECRDVVRETGAELMLRKYYPYGHDGAIELLDEDWDDG